MTTTTRPLYVLSFIFFALFIVLFYVIEIVIFTLLMIDWQLLVHIHIHGLHFWNEQVILCQT